MPTTIHTIAARTALLAGTVFLIGCGEQNVDNIQAIDDCPNVKLICFRVENASDLDFRSFVVSFDGQYESFGPLLAGAVSDYRSVGSAYRYAFTEAFSGERRFILQPIDFVGEQHLSPGTYTYRYFASALEEPRTKGDWRLDRYVEVRLVVVDKSGE